jgi:hypothetical protein
VPTYVLGTFYMLFFCTRATISLFRAKPTVEVKSAKEIFTYSTLAARGLEEHVRLINLKGDIDFLVGGCNGQQIRSKFFKVHFKSNPSFC